MKRAPQAVRIDYFGKLPARSDFIKAAENLPLVTLLDQWLAETMNLLTADPRWKLNYDALKPLPFAFVGNRSRRAIAGHIVASSDQSQRRYPFLMTSAIDIADAAAFLPRSPVVLAPLWQEFDALAADVLAAADPELALRALAATVIELDPGAAEHDAAFLRFLDGHTVAGLQALLAQASVRQMIVAVGLLMQPVRGSGAARLEKSLVLPLPNELRFRHLVAAFWLDLIAPFLAAADFELGLFFVDAGGRQSLVVGFGGAAPETLQAIIDPQCGMTHHITFEHTDWVDEHIATDAAVQKLSACLEQGQLSLRSAHALFHATFC
ncbi:type VI secretion system-associated protein TagF [Rugamonas sp.]|uniref:type VI secretion system-associated protein TagF n=1 Tax=Rugamonas sp. TaxID=1926287 RepID=UPI0025E4499F|nr:type VI secretion system-associated protein TagF [Rugamonas sp.]